MPCRSAWNCRPTTAAHWPAPACASSPPSPWTRSSGQARPGLWRTDALPLGALALHLPDDWRGRLKAVRVTVGTTHHDYSAADLETLWRSLPGLALAAINWAPAGPVLWRAFLPAGLLALGFLWLALGGRRLPPPSPAPALPARPSALTWSWFALGLGVFVSGFALLEMAEPFYFAEDDNFTQFLGPVRYGCEVMDQGGWPDFNPHQLLGVPLAGIAIYGLTYPPLWLACTIASDVLALPGATFDVYAAMHLAAGYGACFALGRRAGLVPPLAMALVVSFALSGFFLVGGRSWCYMLPVATWLPALLLSAVTLAASAARPLIKVDGKPIIEHVVNLFPGIEKITFVCNAEHLATPDFAMAETLARIAPGAWIEAIAPHRLGPVHAVLMARGAIDPDCPVIINYCDFACYWDFADFRRFAAETGAEGVIPCYRGFHPHMLGSTNYAYVRECGGWIEDIQEKQPYTDRPMAEFASSGTYCFASGALMLDAFQRTVSEGHELNGEYYASLAYKPLLADRRRIAVYELQHFMQWGTPENLAEYRAWSAAFRRLAAPDPAPRPRHDGAVLLPMAGLGSRFAEAGFSVPKPLIPVSGGAIAGRALDSLPRAPRTVVVLHRDLPGRERVMADLPADRFVTLDGTTDSQAQTCVLALDEVAGDAPLTIGACDTGALHDAARLQALLGDGNIDLVVWVARGHPPARRRPESYGWVGSDETGHVLAVSVKRPLDDPATDAIVTGSFSFCRADDFCQTAARMFARGAAVNGEYYVDTCIEDAIALGLEVRLFEIDHYLCWGTPDELAAFEYWQSCFHKWPGHPYRLEDDPMVAPDTGDNLARAYAHHPPARPEPAG